MATYYLAVDIGASSGRHILCHMEEGKMILEEIHRFENGMIKKDGHRCWDTEHLFREIKAGIIYNPHNKDGFFLLHPKIAQNVE